MNITSYLNRSDLSTTTAPSKINEDLDFNALLEQIQKPDHSVIKKNTLKVSDAFDMDRLLFLGIAQYAEELRIDSLRTQIRRDVLHDLGITEKKYAAIKKLNEIPDEVRAAFEKEVEEEVERRLQLHLEAEKRSGMKFATTAKTEVELSQTTEADNIHLTELKLFTKALIEKYKDPIKEYEMKNPGELAA